MSPKSVYEGSLSSVKSMWAMIILQNPRALRVPVKVKWSDAPGERDARHLQTFMAEYPQASTAVIVCRTPRRFKLGPKISAVPWQEIPALLDDLR